MRAIRADLPAEHKSIELLVLADYHYADPHSDHDAIRKDIDYVNSHENAYALLAGDLLDCALKSSLGDAYTNLSPMEELTAMMEYLLNPGAVSGSLMKSEKMFMPMISSSFLIP